MQVSFYHFFFLCLFLLTGSCRDSAKQTRIRNIEIKQDIHSSGIINISSTIKFPIAPSEINIRFKPNTHWLGIGSADKFGIRLNNQYGQYIEAGYDVFRQIFFLECRHSSSPEAFVDVPIQPYSIDEAATLDIQILLDTTSITLLSMDGMVKLTSMYFYSAEFDTIELYAENGKVYVESLDITQSNSN